MLCLGTLFGMLALKKIVGHYSEYPFGFTYWSGQTNDVKIREQFSITEMET